MSSKNWNDLPNELKKECISKMDFKTKSNLRSSSKAQKRLISESKHQFDCVLFRTKVIHVKKFLEESYHAQYELIGKNVKFGTELHFVSDDFDMTALETFFATTKIGQLELEAHDLKKLSFKEAVEIVGTWKSKLNVSTVKLSFQKASCLELALIRKCDHYFNIDLYDVSFNVEEQWEPFCAVLSKVRIRKIFISDASQTDSVSRLTSRLCGVYDLMKATALQEIVSSNGKLVLERIENDYPDIIRLKSIGTAELFRVRHSRKLFWRWLSDDLLHFYFVAQVEEIPDFEHIQNKRIREMKMEVEIRERIEASDKKSHVS